VRALPAIAVCASLAAAGCGGGGNSYDSSSTKSTEATTTVPTSPRPAATTPPKKTSPPKAVPRRHTPASLAACIRDGASGSQVLVKARDNEDATFFQDLVGGRVDTVAVTPRGGSAEIDVFLFASPAAAKKAAPQAGGQGLAPKVQGSAVVVAPKAPPPAIANCLTATRYG
jgi:hypothetical protein